jgi:lipopolysaccharide transport system ATP-binding protein
MSSDMGTIAVTGLGKAYRNYPSRKARLAEWVSISGKPRHTLKWILKDITFAVRPGESVAIIGINGAGKSTLLKLLTGTTQPSAGSISMSGRVAALLELGMGFHGDFTGRQNAYMAGQLLGYSMSELERLMPDIEAFAEIGDYIDQPVRIYSSGMQMRLAFSVATAHRPDILIVDEALSVGDAYFQHKSFDRIRQFRREGTTILMVSHEKSVIQSICDRAILLNGGRIAIEGTPDAVLDYYNALLAEKEGTTIERSTVAGGRTQTVSGSGEVTLEAIRLLSQQREVVEVVDVGQRVTLEMRYRAHQPVDTLVIGYLIKDRLGQSAFGTNTHHLGHPLLNVKPGEVITYLITFDATLGPGDYSVSTASVSTSDHLTNNYDWRDLALMFSVVNMTQPHFEGMSWMPPKLEIQRQ